MFTLSSCCLRSFQLFLFTLYDYLCIANVDSLPRESHEEVYLEHASTESSADLTKEEHDLADQPLRSTTGRLSWKNSWNFLASIVASAGWVAEQLPAAWRPVMSCVDIRFYESHIALPVLGSPVQPLVI